MPTALIVDDDGGSLHALRELVEREGFTTTIAGTLEEARRLAASMRLDLLLIDLALPDGSGLDLAREYQDHESTEVVLITGNVTVDSAIAALRTGALDYLTKPVDVDRLKAVLADVASTRERKSEIRTLRRDASGSGAFGALLGGSAAMQHVYDLIGKAAPTNATVLLIGESGTGKDVAAQQLHSLSRRARGPFLAVNCGAISPALIESELFGHMRGSFTGADHSHKGYFERAAGGTLFLDEITEMPIELQSKLLRVLETSAMLRIGADKETEVNVRVIAATNRSPEQAVAEGKLREDLYFRLNVFPIPLPPLRLRDGDAGVLALEFLRRLNESEHAKKTFSDAALKAVSMYGWPGNVRELKNLVHRAFIMSDEIIELDSFLSPARQRASQRDPALATAPPEPSADPATASGVALADDGAMLPCQIGETLAAIARRLTLATLEHFHNDKKVTAKALGVSLRTLYTRLDEYRQGVDADDPSCRS